MNDVVIINANDPDYWPDVRRRTARRNAMAEAKAGFKNTRCGMIYERWVADLMDVVQTAAKNAGFLHDAAQYGTFRQECAEFLVLPEIAIADPEQL